MRSRCCSPPERRPIGASAYSLAPTLCERALDARALVAREPPEAPAMAVEPEADEVARAQREVAVEGALLRHVADALPAFARRPAVHLHASGRRLEQAEQDADQRRLARAVRAEHGEELAGLQLEAEVFPEHALAEAQAEIFDRGDGAHRASAAAVVAPARAAIAGRCSCGGSVSVTPTTGMCARAAAARTRDVIGETAWLL